jgi:transposase
MQPQKWSAIMNTEYAVLVGLDWADQKHDLCWRDTASGQRHTLVLKNRPECINAWVVEQLARHPGGRIAVCLEQSRGTVIYALMEYPQIDLYPVNPLSLAEYRKVHHPGGAKDDPKDAALLLDLLERHSELLRRLQPDTEQTRLLRSLCEDRRKLVNQRTAINNRLCARLKEYYPQALDLIGDHAYSPMACAWLRRWPRFEMLAAARPDTVRRFYHAHHVRNDALITKRLALIAESRPLTTDAAVIEAALRLIRALLPQIQVLNECIADYDKRIDEIFRTHPDAELFAGLPGAGRQLAPRLLTVFGTDRTRYTSVVEVTNYTGISPVISRSGKQCWVHWRWSCPTYLRQSLVEFAGHSIGSSIWAKIYYDEQIKRGKKHHAAVRALAFKWLRILFRCWQERVPYDEARYLAALQRHGSWIANTLQSVA